MPYCIEESHSIASACFSKYYLIFLLFFHYNDSKSNDCPHWLYFFHSSWDCANRLLASLLHTVFKVIITSARAKQVTSPKAPLSTPWVSQPLHRGFHVIFPLRFYLLTLPFPDFIISSASAQHFIFKLYTHAQDLFLIALTITHLLSVPYTSFHMFTSNYPPRSLFLLFHINPSAIPV